MLATLTKQLESLRPLSGEQTHEAVELLVNEAVDAAAKADFLCALAAKGESIDEIAAFARSLREKSIAPPLEESSWRNGREILDVCGTGGDHLGTFNISTTVALICAAAGVAVAKHGNRAITSTSGSADVLEALGVRIDLSPADAARSLTEHNFAFFFAPNFHPAFKHIAAARKLCADRGQRTIFNYLGPLLNPARPTAQLIGVPRVELCEPVARVLQTLGVRRGMVVCGEVPASPENATGRMLDELSPLGANTIAEFYQERGFAVSSFSAEQLPLQPTSLAHLRGGDRMANAEITRAILHGDECGPKRDAVLLNAGAALMVGGKAKSIAAGWELAAAVIDDGRAAAKLKTLQGKGRA